MSWNATHAVRDHSTLAGSEFTCLLVLSTYADAHGGNIFPSMTRLAKECRMSVRNIRYVVRKLVASGELVDTGRMVANNVHVYQLGEALQKLLHSPNPQALQNRTPALQSSVASPAIAVAAKRSGKRQKKGEWETDPHTIMSIGTESDPDYVKTEIWKIRGFYIRGEQVFFADGTAWPNPPQTVFCDELAKVRGPVSGPSEVIWEAMA